MNYGKNQQALLKFLQKHPNRWHRIKGRKAIDAAIRLSNRGNLIEFWRWGDKYEVMLPIPQMLQKQA